MKRTPLAVAAAAVMACALTASSQLAAIAKTDEPLAELYTFPESDSEAIPGKYVVMLHNETRSSLEVSQAAEEARSFGANVTKELDGVGAYIAHLTPEQVEKVRKDPKVMVVEQDHTFTLPKVVEEPTPAQANGGSQSGATWGIDRSDQRDLPLDKTYKYNRTGKGVNSYIIDTGITSKHNEFTGRLGQGVSVAPDELGSTEDSNMHGTHVAGTVGGTKFGIAKETTLYPIKVLGVSGKGEDSVLVTAIDWVVKNHKKPAVANMSLGSDVSERIIDEATKRAVDAGVVMVSAAGNDGKDAAGTTPARVPESITVGNLAKDDRPSPTSNFGAALDIWAPGAGITSAKFNTTDGTSTLSGTSMAAPHVAGAVALILEANPTATPAEVARILAAATTKNKIKGVPGGTINSILYTLFDNGPGPAPQPTSQPTTPPRPTMPGWPTRPPNPTRP